MNFAAHHSLHHSSLSLPTLVLLGHCLVPEGNVCVCVCVCVCARARARARMCVLLSQMGSSANWLYPLSLNMILLVLICSCPYSEN